MKLYHFPISPNSRRVVVVLHALKLDCELVALDLFKGEHLQAEFVSINPNHMIPTLVDGDFVLWESNAIMQYLAAKVPNNPLWPSDAKIQADISRWQFWQVAHFGSACGIFVFENLLKPLLNKGEADPAELAKGAERFHRFAQVLEDHLANRQWLVGDHYTLADLSVGSWLALAEAASYPLENYPVITGWYNAIQSIPAWESSALQS